MWRRARHQFILAFIGPCKINGYMYLVSPFMRKGTLHAFIKDNPMVDRARLVCHTAPTRLDLG